MGELESFLETIENEEKQYIEKLELLLNRIVYSSNNGYPTPQEWESIINEIKSSLKSRQN